MIPGPMPACPQQLIVLGPPGSGKSTHAARVAERLGAAHVNLGALFRELGKHDPAIGAALSEGRLLPDDVAERVVRERLAALPDGQGFVLDGYPRSPAQAAALRRMLSELGRLEPRPVVVRLDVPRDELVRRLTRRRDLEGRPDDTDAAIAHRLAHDGAQAQPLIDAMAGWFEVVDVDGAQPVEAVTEQIVAALRCPS
ncbi:MAG TPA: nucleoside monophosphate kinase [Solirubrobacteraceae bacterium]|nr:nucleoside monophosphate kinase [Solirubrobacteraceae bacterium]